MLGIANRGSGRMKGAYWWNEEVNEKVKAKREAYITLIGSGSKEEKEINTVQYKIAKREAKKSVAVSKNNAHDRLY